jgi:hypothetical protein
VALEPNHGYHNTIDSKAATGSRQKAESQKILPSGFEFLPAIDLYLFLADRWGMNFQLGGP